MTDFIKVARVADIPNGSMRTFQVSGKKLAIANMDGEVFAIDDRCSHEECSLGSEGYLDGQTVVCGCHGAQFDVTNGKVLSLPATVNVGSYKTKLDGEFVFVEI